MYQKIYFQNFLAQRLLTNYFKQRGLSQSLNFFSIFDQLCFFFSLYTRKPDRPEISVNILTAAKWSEIRKRFNLGKLCIHSSKEQWIIVLVYLADSQCKKMSVSITWASLWQSGQSKQQKEKFSKDENHNSRYGWLFCKLTSLLHQFSNFRVLSDVSA